MCPARSLWGIFRRARWDRRGLWNRFWSMSCFSSSSSIFIWLFTILIGLWRAFWLTWRWGDRPTPNACPCYQDRLLKHFGNVLTADYLSAWFLYSQTRYPLLENPEMLRKSAEDFLNRAAVTDAGLLFSPSQLALTAVLNGAARAGLKMEA